MCADTVRDYGCVECGCLIAADRAPKCPECAVDMRPPETVETVDGDQMHAVAERLKTVKQLLHDRDEWGVNINTVQYAIRAEVANDAAPVVLNGEFNAAKLPHLLEALGIIRDTLDDPKLRQTVADVHHEVAKLNDNRTRDGVCTTGSETVYAGSPEALRRALLG